MKSRNQEPSSSQQHQGDTINKAETVGEELYLVHLRRHEGEQVRPEDFDFSEDGSNSTNNKINKKRSGSIGEELWNVHVKRSRGMEPDTDNDEAGQEPPKDEPIQSPSRYNLRTRRSKNHSSQ